MNDNPAHTPDGISVRLKTIDGNILPLDNIPTSLSVLNLKQRVEESTGTPVDRQRIIFRGKVLKNEQTLDSYHVENDHVLHLVVKPDVAQEPSPVATTTAPATVPQPTGGAAVTTPVGALGAAPANALQAAGLLPSVLAGMNAARRSRIRDPPNGFSLEHVYQGLATVDSLVSTMPTIQRVLEHDSHTVSDHASEPQELAAETRDYHAPTIFEDDDDDDDDDYNEEDFGDPKSDLDQDDEQDAGYGSDVQQREQIPLRGVARGSTLFPDETRSSGDYSELHHQAGSVGAHDPSIQRHNELDNALRSQRDNGSSARPATGDNYPHPTTGDNYPHPTTGDNYPHPTTGDNYPHPTTGDNYPRDTMQHSTQIGGAETTAATVPSTHPFLEVVDERTNSANSEQALEEPPPLVPITSPRTVMSSRQSPRSVSTMTQVDDDSVAQGDGDNAAVANRVFVQGQWIDVKDTVNQWLEATVMRMSEDRSQVFVHYNEWPSRWDEWIDVNSNRIAPFRTKTSHPVQPPFLSPTPVAWVQNARVLGTDRLADLIPKVQALNNKINPVFDEVLRLRSQVDMNQSAEDAAEGKFNTCELESQISLLTSQLAPLVDRYGRMLADLAPLLASRPTLERNPNASNTSASTHSNIPVGSTPEQPVPRPSPSLLGGRASRPAQRLQQWPTFPRVGGGSRGGTGNTGTLASTSSSTTTATGPGHVASSLPAATVTAQTNNDEVTPPAEEPAVARSTARTNRPNSLSRLAQVFVRRRPGSSQSSSFASSRAGEGPMEDGVTSTARATQPQVSSSPSWVFDLLRRTSRLRTSGSSSPATQQQPQPSQEWEAPVLRHSASGQPLSAAGSSAVSSSTTATSGATRTEVQSVLTPSQAHLPQTATTSTVAPQRATAATVPAAPIPETDPFWNLISVPRESRPTGDIHIHAVVLNASGNGASGGSPGQGLLNALGVGASAQQQQGLQHPPANNAQRVGGSVQSELPAGMFPPTNPPAPRIQQRPPFMRQRSMSTSLSELGSTSTMLSEERGVSGLALSGGNHGDEETDDEDDEELNRMD